MPPGKNDLLRGWKEIASALGVSVRTAQRWQRLEGMPVEHHQHHERSTAVASRVALGQWHDGRRLAAVIPPPPPGPPSQKTSVNRMALFLGGAGLGIGLAALTALAVFVGRWPAPAPRHPLLTLQAPQHVYGVQKVERRNEFAMCDLVTGECDQEWRFCPKSPGYTVPFYAGFVITKLKVAMTGECMFLDDTSGDMETFVIARGKQREDARRDPYNYIYRDVTRDQRELGYGNWADRPVLARNCAPPPDDATIVCTGGEAEFRMAESSNSKP